MGRMSDASVFAMTIPVESLARNSLFDRNIKRTALSAEEPIVSSRSRARLFVSLILATLFLVACGREHRDQNKQTYSGDWRQLRRAEKDNRWGYIDHSGKFAIAPQFVDEANFSEGLAWAVAPKTPYGYIDKTGAWVVKPQFRYAMDFSEGLAAVCNRDEKWGFIDNTGKYVVPPRFDHAQRFSEGLAAVERAGKWGFIDKTGKFAIEPRFSPSSNFFYWKSYFSGGVAVIQAERSSFELIDRNGNVIKQFNASRMHPFCDGLALIELPQYKRCHGGEYAFINTAGEFAFPQTFCRANEFSEGLAAVLTDEGLYGYIDTSGLFVVAPQFPLVTDFSGGLAAVKLDLRDPRWCYIDRTGRIVIKPVGDGRADKFIGGLAAVDLNCPRGYLAKGAVWGYIDPTGKVICTFTRAKSQTW